MRLDTRRPDLYMPSASETSVTIQALRLSSPSKNVTHWSSFDRHLPAENDSFEHPPDTPPPPPPAGASLGTGADMQSSRMCGAALREAVQSDPWLSHGIALPVEKEDEVQARMHLVILDALLLQGKSACDMCRMPWQACNCKIGIVYALLTSTPCSAWIFCWHPTREQCSNMRFRRVNDGMPPFCGNKNNNLQSEWLNIPISPF